MVNHHKVHVIFQDSEYQLQGDIFITFFIIDFYEIFIKWRSIFDPFKFIYLKVMLHYDSFILSYSSIYLLTFAFAYQQIM